MTKLAEAYLNFRSIGNDASPNILGDEALRIAVHSARESYPFEVWVEVTLVEGSLKVWATVIGAVAAVYYGVAAYPDFKSGTAELYSDARKYGSLVVENLPSIYKAQPGSLLRTERRTMTPGRLLRLLEEAERFEYSTTQRAPTRADLVSMQKRLDAILEDLSPNARDVVERILQAPSAPKVLQNLLPSDLISPPPTRILPVGPSEQEFPKLGYQPGLVYQQGAIATPLIAGPDDPPRR